MARKRNNYAMLLRIRKRQEDMRAMTLAAARREVLHAEEHCASIAQQQRRTLDAAREAAQARFDASEVRLYYQYERHLARLGVEGDARLQELRRTAETHREALVQASQKKRIVERLKERQEDLLMKEFRKQEQELANEVAVNYSVLGRMLREDDQ